MKDYVEFAGKTLDDAINDALSYFGVEREKLEIEIVNDAKTGIFGLVGVKKATVRARRAQLAAIDLDLGKAGKAAKAAQAVNADQAANAGKTAQTGGAARKGESAATDGITVEGREGASVLTEEARSGGRRRRERSEHQEKDAQGERGQGERARDGRAGQNGRADQSGRAGRKPQGRPVPPVKPAQPAHFGQTEPKSQLVQPVPPAHSGQSGQPLHFGRSAQSGQSSQSSHKRKAGSKSAQPEKFFIDESAPDFDEQLPQLPLESIDQEMLRSVVLETLSKLIRPIVGEAESSFSLSDGRVNLRVHCAENHGLLIGRDGQTLASLQYLLSCIASRRLGASIRVQIDAGDYREKQDEKLRELALSLAQKVKSGSRPQSTRPLSAYHRRIIHMTLQDDPEVQTHSKGEGGLKRVVVVPRRR